jgi:hypothetical protein
MPFLVLAVALLFTWSSCVGVSCGVFPFTYAAQFPLHGIFSSPANPQIPLDEPVYQASEFQQVRHAEYRTVSTHGDLRINSDDVSPCGGTEQTDSSSICSSRVIP